MVGKGNLAGEDILSGKYQQVFGVWRKCKPDSVSITQSVMVFQHTSPLSVTILLISRLSLTSNPSLQIMSYTEGDRHVVIGSFGCI